MFRWIVHGGHVPSRKSSIPVITHARSSPFFRLRSRVHMYLTYIKCSNLNTKGHGKNAYSLNSLNIFHENIRGLRNKSDKLMNSSVVDSINPHILCLSKHHMEEKDLMNLTVTGYSLSSSYCCQNLQRGRVCIFVREHESFNKTDTSLNCEEQTFEVCAIELETKSSNLRI
jgi:hypothetical protein